MENNNNGNDSENNNNNVNNNVNNNNNDNINLGAINLLITNFQSSTPLNDEDINVAEILMELFNQDNSNNQEENNQEENNEQENNEQEQSDINSSIRIRRSISQFNNFFNNYVRTIENPIEVQINNSINNSINNYSFINSFVNSYINYENRGSIFDNVLFQSLNQKSVYKNVISEEGKNELKKINYKANDVYNTSCPISLIDFEEDQEVMLLPCNHCFFKEAIEKWLEEEKAECPVCRFKLKNKEIKNDCNESNNINMQMQHQIEIQRQNQNDDFFQNRQNLFRSLSNAHNYNSIPINHPYGPFREEQLTIIPHSYIPIANNDIINDNIIANIFSTEEMSDIEMAILLSVNSMYDLSSNNLDELD